MIHKQNISKAQRNYYFDIIMFSPFLLVLVSGLFMLKYHAGAAYSETILGLSGTFWFLFHKVFAVIVVPMVTLHIWWHFYWVKSLSKKKKKGKNNDMNVSLLVLFILCVLTAFLSWLVLADKPAADLLREIHNKLGLALLLFFIIHLKNYLSWLINMSKKIMEKG